MWRFGVHCLMGRTITIHKAFITCCVLFVYLFFSRTAGIIRGLALGGPHSGWGGVSLFSSPLLETRPASHPHPEESREAVRYQTTHSHTHTPLWYQIPSSREVGHTISPHLLIWAQKGEKGFCGALLKHTQPAAPVRVQSSGKGNYL